MSLNPFPPDPIAAQLSFSFGDSFPGTTFAVFCAVAAATDRVAVVVAVARKALRVIFDVLIVTISFRIFDPVPMPRQ